MIKQINLLTIIISILTVLFCSFGSAQAFVQDELVEATLNDKELENPYQPYKYNYESLKRIPIELRVMVSIKSEKDVKEGERVVFWACNDIYEHGRKILKKNDTVYARVETIIQSGMNGIPASIILGDFRFDNIDSAKVTDSVEIFGQDRSLWVFPLKWALTILPPTGSLTNFIKGGHAKLKDRETITLYYYPNW